VAVPAGRALLFAFYLNELVMRLLARGDPPPPPLFPSNSRPPGLVVSPVLSQFW